MLLQPLQKERELLGHLFTGGRMQFPVAIELHIHHGRQHSVERFHRSDEILRLGLSPAVEAEKVIRAGPQTALARLLPVLLKVRVL